MTKLTKQGPWRFGIIWVAPWLLLVKPSFKALLAFISLLFVWMSAMSGNANVVTPPYIDWVRFTYDVRICTAPLLLHMMKICHWHSSETLTVRQFLSRLRPWYLSTSPRGQNWFKSGLLWSTVIYCASGWSVLSSTITDLSCGVSLCQPMFEILGSFALQWIYDWTAWLLDSIWFKLIQWCLILQWPQFGPLDSVSNSLQQRHSWITVRNGGHRYGRHC